MDHADVINSCDEKARSLGIEPLNDVERAIHLASWADFEILLGGIDAFYFNSAGNDAVEMVAALQTIGAVQAAKALESANALFPGGQPNKSPSLRFEALLGIRNLPGDQLNELTSLYYDQSPDVGYLVYRYIDAHPHDLREHWDGSPLE